MILVTTAETEAAAACAGLQAAGYLVRDGWALSEVPWDATDRRIACAGPVESDADIAAAVLAAVRGAAVVATFRGTEADRVAFVEELGRVGPVLTTYGRGHLAGLSEDQSRLLELLAAGSTTEEAASEMFLSVRTAERRLAAIRKTLGVRTTAEAIVLFQRS